MEALEEENKVLSKYVRQRARLTEYREDGKLHCRTLQAALFTAQSHKLSNDI